MPRIFELSTTRTVFRLDQFVAEHLPQLTRAHAKRLINEGCVSVNGSAARPSSRLKPGDTISVVVPDPPVLDPTPQEIPLSVVFEDADVLVVDKQTGLPVHPGPGHPNRTLVNALLFKYPDLAHMKGSPRPGIVHRLDKDTSGLIMIARNEISHEELARQIKERAITKKYLSLTKGRLNPKKGSIEGPIGRDPRNRKRMVVLAGGREARTLYRVLEYLGDFTLVEASLVTGRTHQIRTHFSSIGHPIVGDSMYGGRSPLLQRQFLHATELCFRHPRTGAPIQCIAPLPEDLKRVLALLDCPSGQS